ncbi:carboxypeptidase-like regulatory domain-containing protein [Chitinophaga vietnamensis]|uniref:carboxypeptidase-like regulatory domain-containing protein n=1 Tax=Chitinophaga vietnamensis TaxID=2593957 RepID=UPI001177A3A5|nr:carboxypeptidase-like regulatory domain-containing protein [Chitinophaga vietnamensis]
MPDKQPHKQTEVSAELIRQYLAGELDDKAMHALERQALDDPFLAEALEGYEMHAPDQSAHLDDLQARLAARVAPEKGKVRSIYYRVAAAAAILLLLFTGGWFLVHQKATPPEVAQAPATPAPTPAPAAADTQATFKENTTPQADINSEHAAPALALSQKKPSMKPKPAPGKPVADLPAPAPLPDAAPALAAAPVSAKKAGNDNKQFTYEAEKARAGNALDTYSPGIAINNDSPKIFIRGARAFNNDDLKSKIILRGRVVDGQSGEPLSGVAVTGLHSNRGTITDAKGYFSLPKDSTRFKELMLSYIGYDSRKLRLDSVQQGMDIAMAPNNKGLSEVVVTAFSGKVAGVEAEPMPYSAPEPKDGYVAFYQYLNAHTLTDSISGIVRISFTVTRSGALTDFKVLRGLSETADALAIRLLNEGPAWKPASDGKPATVKVRMKFRIQKK